MKYFHGRAAVIVRESQPGPGDRREGIHTSEIKFSKVGKWL